MDSGEAGHRRRARARPGACDPRETAAPGSIRPRAAADRRLGGGLADYAPAKVEQITGVAAKRVERLARDLAEQTPAVAIAGGPALAHTNAMFTALAVNALSELLGAVDQPGGIFFTPGVATPASAPFTSESIGSLATDESDPARRSESHLHAHRRR